MNTQLGKSTLKSVVFLVVVALNTGCPDNRGEFTPEEVERLLFTDVSLSTSRASVNEQVTVSWDYENPDLLVKQKAFIISASIIGGIEVGPEIELDSAARSFSFTFSIPVTIDIIAEDEDTIDDDDSVADEIAFDVLLDESNFFTLGYLNLTNPKYPSLGNDGISDTVVHCSNFLGFYDPPQKANNVVDDFAQFQNVLPTEHPFYARSRSVEEAEGFAMKMGSAYQFLSEQSPEFGYSNAYAFASAIAYSGRTIPIKTKEGGFEGRGAQDGQTLTFEPIFINIALLVGHQTGLVDIVDIHLGNLRQGLIVTMTTGFTQGLDTRGVTVNPNDAADGISFSGTNGGTTNGKIRGLIKTGVVGQSITTLNGNIFDAMVGISLHFDMPFLMDDAII